MPSALKTLADRVGIIPEYVDQTGKERRVTSDRTREALLAVMRIDAGSEKAARATLEAMARDERERLVAPVRVIGEAALAKEKLRVLVPDDLPARVEWTLELEEEQGHVHRRAGHARRGRDGALALALPSLPRTGYHTLRLRLAGKGQEREAEQSLIVVPPACCTPREVLGNRRVFGLTANLYTVRSARDWGVGDFTDLGELLAWSGEIGSAFVGVNPLHALRNRGGDVSPYSPVSRLFRNVLYLDVTAVPELAETPAARDRMATEAFRRELAELRRASHVEYARVMALKRPLLELLYRTFAARHRGRDTRRGEQYESYCANQGEWLEQFATFCALEEHFARQAGRETSSWRQWPEDYRDPRSAAVRAFRAANADAVGFHRWLQFELDCQLEAAAKRGHGAGLPIGLYQDLAIGTSPDGSDTWSYPELFLEGVSIGAPPDLYSSDGQNWGLPPLDPRRLTADRYRYWIRLVQSAFQHAGALRIDHVMGLFRQFWIPQGMSGKHGAYVRFPSEDLLGILALESRRAGALVVGEDLGTVPKDVPPAMAKWGLLSSKVLYFERDRKGGFTAAAEYAPMALATANTHDMATLAGFWDGRDLVLREQVGLVKGKKVVRAAAAERERDKAALLRRLVAEGLLPEMPEQIDSLELRSLVHAFLHRTPAALVGLSLDDIAGEVEPVNVPGVGPDVFPSWTRRLAEPIEALRADPDARRALGYERMWTR